MANGFEVSSEYQYSAQPNWGHMSAGAPLGASPEYLQLVSHALPGLQESLWTQLNANAASCRSAVWANPPTSCPQPQWNQNDRLFSHKQATSHSLVTPSQQPALGAGSTAADLLAVMLHAQSLASNLSYNPSTPSTSSPGRNISSQPKAGKWPVQHHQSNPQSLATDHALSMLAALSSPLHTQQLSHPMTLPLTSRPQNTEHLLTQSMATPSWFNPLLTQESLLAQSAELSLQQQLADGVRLPSSTALTTSLLGHSTSGADSNASSDSLFDAAMYGSSPSCSSPSSGSPAAAPTMALPGLFDPSLFHQQAAGIAGVNVARSDVSDASTDTVKGGSGGEEEFSEEEITAAAWERSRTLAVLGIKYDGVVSAELRRSVGAPFQHLKGFVGVYMPAMSLRSCKTNRRSRSFAFIKFSTPDAAAAALDSILQTCPEGTVPIILPGAGRTAVHCQVERVQEKSTADLVQKYRSFVKSCQRLGLYHLLS